MQKGALTAAKMKSSANSMAHKMESKTKGFASRAGFKVPKIQRFK